MNYLILIFVLFEPILHAQIGNTQEQFERTYGKADAFSTLNTKPLDLELGIKHFSYSKFHINVDYYSGVVYSIGGNDLSKGVFNLILKEMKKDPNFIQVNSSMYESDDISLYQFKNGWVASKRDKWMIINRKKAYLYSKGVKRKVIDEILKIKIGAKESTLKSYGYKKSASGKGYYKGSIRLAIKDEEVKRIFVTKLGGKVKEQDVKRFFNKYAPGEPFEKSSKKIKNSYGFVYTYVSKTIKIEVFDEVNSLYESWVVIEGNIAKPEKN